jgi:N-acetylglucosaminyldiphosphoundecaprenol N-acetyl-beta-D-mannosaminyltransferase
MHQAKFLGGRGDRVKTSAPMRPAEKVHVLGIWIDDISEAEAIRKMEQFIDRKDPVYLVTPNVDHIVKMQEDAEFRKSYEESSLVLCDSAPLLWASRFLKTPISHRVCGSNLLPRFSQIAAKKQYALFFLGGKPQSAEKTAEILKRRFPGLPIAGIYCPPFGFEKDKTENDKTIRLIREARPDVLFVGLGTPKQEIWINQFHKRIEVPVSVGIGASFEFISGRVKRAPAWVQKMGFEWLWRLMLEPGRLWKRYLWDDLRFFFLVLEQKLK